MLMNDKINEKVFHYVKIGTLLFAKSYKIIQHG